MQIKLDDFIVPGVTLTLDNVANEHAPFMQMLVAVVRAQAADALDRMRKQQPDPMLRAFGDGARWMN